MVNQQAVAIACAVILNTLSLITLIMRYWSRVFLLRRTFPEDFVILVAGTALVVYTVFVGYAVGHGLGSADPDNVSVDQQKRIQFGEFCCAISYCVAMTTAKISILLQMIHYFVRKYQKTAIWIFIAAIGAFGAWSMSYPIYICTPISAWWGVGAVDEAACGDWATGWFVVSGWTIATDLIVALLPIPMLKPLQLPTAQKRGLMACFALGGATVIISLLRIPSLIDFAHAVDWISSDWKYLLWTAAEINTAICCACLVTIRPALKHLFPQWFGGTQKPQPRGAQPPMLEASHAHPTSTSAKALMSSFTSTHHSYSIAPPTVIQDVSVVEVMRGTSMV